ncbi:MAG: hypothetical protein IT463_10385 [Planctomycetes bacterium]|nr:hypothetical protein [Planctomycetota bacterium]
MAHFGEMAKLQKEYEGQVTFLFVYTREAHPDDGPDNRSEAQPNGGWRIKGNAYQVNKHTKYAEREKQAKALAKEKSGWRVLPDDMKDTIQKGWGDLPNHALLVDPQGRIAGKWAWVSSATGQKRTEGDSPDVRTLLKDKPLEPCSIADDPQLPLYDTRSGEWLRYGDELVTFSATGENAIERKAGDKAEAITLKAPALKDRAKPVLQTHELKGLKLPCVVVTNANTETWICPWLPGDGVVKVITDGKIVRELTDAGFEPEKTCLTPYDPDAK